MKKRWSFYMVVLVVCFLIAPLPRIVSAAFVPRELRTIEVRAGDIAGEAHNRNWTGIDRDAAIIAQAWKEYMSTVGARVMSEKRRDRMTAFIDRLEATATAKSPLATMQAANNVEFCILDIIDIYHPSTPTDIGRLGVFERQIIIDLSSPDFGAAYGAFGRLRTLWQRLKPQLRGRGGSTIETNFEANLAAQGQFLKNRNRQGAISQARKGLTIIGEMDKLFAP